jgi:hypothetical protein
MTRRSDRRWYLAYTIGIWLALWPVDSSAICFLDGCNTSGCYCFLDCGTSYDVSYYYDSVSCNFPWTCYQGSCTKLDHFGEPPCFACCSDFVWGCVGE